MLEAYEALSDPEKRRQYDRVYRARRPAPRPRGAGVRRLEREGRAGTSSRRVARLGRRDPHAGPGARARGARRASGAWGQAGQAVGVRGALRYRPERAMAGAYAKRIIKNAPDPVFVSDLQGKILQANDAV